MIGGIEFNWINVHDNLIRVKLFMSDIIQFKYKFSFIQNI